MLHKIFLQLEQLFKAVGGDKADPVEGLVFQKAFEQVRGNIAWMAAHATEISELLRGLTPGVPSRLSTLLQ